MNVKREFQDFRVFSKHLLLENMILIHKTKRNSFIIKET
jgi:hypothetical protein